MLTVFETESAKLHHEVSDYQSRQYLLHSHPRYEFYYFVRGSVMYSVGGYQVALKPHTFLFIPPETEHGCKILSTETYERYVFEFDPLFLSNTSNQQLLALVKEQFNPEFPLYEWPDATGIHALMEQFLKCAWLSSKQKNELLSRLVGTILFHLLMSKPASWEMVYRDSMHQPLKPKWTVEEIVYWINANIAMPITVEQITQKFFISKSTLNRYFQSLMGQSVRDYIRAQRIEIAIRFIEEGYTATAAAAHAGFKDYSTFYRAYKNRVGHSPNEKN